VIAGHIGVDDHHRGALPFDIDQRGQEIGVRAAGHVGLAARDHQAVAVDRSPGGARRIDRLGEGKARALVARQHRQQVAGAQRLGHAGKHAGTRPEHTGQVQRVVQRERLAHHQQRELGRVVLLGEVVDAGGLGGGAHPGRPLGGAERGIVAQRGELAAGQGGHAIAQRREFGGKEFGHATSQRGQAPPGPQGTPYRRPTA
jgi:hypothetical protein